MPFCHGAQAVRQLADADNATRGVERSSHLLRGAGECGGDVELTSEPPGDRSEQPLPGQSLLEREARPEPLERDGGLGGERLHHRQVLVREHPCLVERGDRDHGCHALLNEERDEGGALRAHGVGYAPADEARALGVVDRECGRLEHRARDSRRLFVQIEAQVAPPVEILSGGAREIAGGLPPVVGDEGEGDEADVEELRKLVEQRAGDALDVGAPRQLVGHAAHALELPLAGRTSGTRSATAKDREQKQRGGRGAAERANGREPVWDPH